MRLVISRVLRSHLKRHVALRRNRAAATAAHHEPRHAHVLDCHVTERPQRRSRGCRARPPTGRKQVGRCAVADCAKPKRAKPASSRRRSQPGGWRCRSRCRRSDGHRRCRASVRAVAARSRSTRPVHQPPVVLRDRDRDQLGVTGRRCWLCQAATRSSSAKAWVATTKGFQIRHLELLSRGGHVVWKPFFVSKQRVPVGTPRFQISALCGAGLLSDDGTGG